MNGNIGNMGDMGSMIAKMLEDPEALEKVMSIAGTLSSSGILNGISTGENNANKEIPDREDLRYTHNAEGENIRSEAKEDPLVNTEKTYYSQSKTSESPLKKQISSYRKIKSCDRIRLLEAMRPFLSDEKRDKLDVVIKIIGLADAAGGLYKGK